MRQFLAIVVIIQLVLVRPAWAHGEQMLVNFGVGLFLVPLWAYISRRLAQVLPEAISAQTWSWTVVAMCIGIGWALFGATIVSTDAFIGPPLSFAALSITGLPSAVALYRTGRIQRCVFLVGVPVIAGLLTAFGWPNP